MPLRTMGPKTRAEIQRAYRERKKQRDGDTKKPKKPRNEVQRSYREKKKLENKDGFLEKKRNRKRKSYIPISLLTETEQAKRRKANREKSMRFREKSRRNKKTLESPSTAGSENNIHNDNTPQLIVKLEVTPVQGTMTVHAVAAISPGKIIARNTTCYCHQCFRDGTYNPESPIPSGKGQRQFRLHDETSAMIEGLFAKHQANRN